MVVDKSKHLNFFYCLRQSFFPRNLFSTCVRRVSRARGRFSLLASARWRRHPQPAGPAARA